MNIQYLHYYKHIYDDADSWTMEYTKIIFLFLKIFVCVVFSFSLDSLFSKLLFFPFVWPLCFKFIHWIHSYLRRRHSDTGGMLGFFLLGFRVDGTVWGILCGTWMSVFLNSFSLQIIRLLGEFSSSLLLNVCILFCMQLIQSSCFLITASPNWAGCSPDQSVCFTFQRRNLPASIRPGREISLLQ